MTLAERYRGAVEVAHLAAGDEDILLPKVLARASVEVLPFCSPTQGCRSRPWICTPSDPKP